MNKDPPCRRLNHGMLNSSSDKEGKPTSTLNEKTNLVMNYINVNMKEKMTIINNENS